ncbi:MAG: hypothetical protein IJW22_04070 [Clostridia bacterium]|nr:hypothetical protein [Clostridia bacterium]
MKKIRIASLLLALLMLCGCCVMFSSCGERVGVAKLSGKQESVDLKGYSVVFASSFFITKTMVDQVSVFAQKLSDATGVSITSAADTKTKSEKDDPEILIGLTDRSQSTKVQNAIKGDGFAIQLVDNKIVITGSSNMHILQAMCFFTEHFLGEVKGSALTVDKKVTANRLDSIALADTNACSAAFVYQAGLTVDKAPGSIYTYGGRDCATTLIDDIVQALASATGLKQSAKNFLVRPDSEAADGTEFMVGSTDREVYRQCLAELEGDEYGIFVRDGQFVLAAYNDLALSNGKTLLAELIKDAVVEKDGVKTVAFPEGFKVTGLTGSEIVTGFTKPEKEGIELHSTFYAGNDSLQYYYTGSAVNADSYKAYRDALVAEGYAVISENSIEGSHFITLESKSLGHTLYVSYNAFSHKGEYEKTKDDARYAACIRVVSAPLGSVTLPDSTLLTQNLSYNKKTESAITTMEILSTAAGMCYIVTLEDGRFIVFDSGGVNDAGDEHDQLYQLLAKRNEQVTGSPTSSGNPIHIAA